MDVLHIENKLSMKKEIENIIVKFLTNVTNEEELEKLAKWLKDKDNVLLFDRYVKMNYALDMNLNKFNSDAVKIALRKKKRQDKSVFYRLRTHKVLKYAAAAVIIFGLGYFFRDKIDTTSVVPATEIVNTDNIIEPGTDKAILTLEDGSKITLEKGKSFQTQNANSDGEALVYKTHKEESKEIVYNYLTIPRGGQYFVELNDGTKVWLNSESELKYPTSFIPGEERVVELVYGEAYFDVSPSAEHEGSKFMVINQSQEIEVLGTEFNIKAYKDETNIYTTLVEGKVTVSNDMIKQNLVPNQQSILDTKTNRIEVDIVNVNNEISWRNGVFSFIDMPLKDIMKVLSRWYDVDVIFLNKELKSVQFLGVIEKRHSIEKILSIMKSTSINSYKINGKTIILE